MSAPVQVGPSPSGGGPAPYVPAVRAYPARTDEPRSYVTSRQRQILTLAANGNTNRSIGRALGIGEEAVKSQMQKILRKLRAADRTQAVAVALRLGLISLEDVELPPHANQGYRHPA